MYEAQRRNVAREVWGLRLRGTGLPRQQRHHDEETPLTSSLTKLAVAGGVVALGFAMAPAGAHAQDAPNEDPAPIESVPCVVTGSSVRGGTATIEVGPDNCNVAVGPISFSAFNLPSGERWPYDMQELIAHHPANGATYTAGSYTLNLDFAVPCNWQTDLYFGNSETNPSFGDRLLNSDWVENRVCVEETTPTTIAAETAGPTTTTALGGGGGETTATTVMESAGPTTTAMGNTMTTDVASAGPTNQVGGNSGATARANPAGTTGALPATGPTETLMIGLLGGALLGLGTLARRVARS